MDWNSLLESILYSVITCIVPIVTYYLVGLLEAKKKSIKEDKNDRKMKNTLDTALELIIKVVSSTSQVYVSTLKSAGKFNDSAKKEAFNMAKATIMHLLDDETKILINAVYQDLDTWLDVQIEACIDEMKRKGGNQ